MAGKQLSSERSAIDRDEWTRLARTVLVDGSRDQLFAGPARTGNEYVRRERGNLGDFFAQRLDPRGPADKMGLIHEPLQTRRWQLSRIASQRLEADRAPEQQPQGATETGSGGRGSHSPVHVVGSLPRLQRRSIWNCEG